MPVKIYWLIALPLAAAAVIYVGRMRRILTITLGLVIAVACAGISLSLPQNEAMLLLGQTWVLDPVGQKLLAGLYLTTAILLAIAAVTEQAQSFCAPALVSVGSLSAAVLIRPLLLSFLLLPIALVALLLAATPSPWSMRGASRFLALVMLPIPFILALFKLLERFVLFPDEVTLTGWAALLVVPAIGLWLTLFPFHGTTCLWAAGELPLAPALLWTAKDWVVFYLLFALWRENPVLQTGTAMASLGMLGLATAIISGVWACVQSSPSALLACAAMSELGVALQGAMTGSVEGLASGLFLLLSRSVAVLLASAALAAMHGFSIHANTPSKKLRPWWTMLPWIAFVVSILSLAGVPPLGGFLGRQRIYAAIQPQGTYLLLAWLAASFGVVLGVVHAVYSLLRRREPKAMSIHGALVALCLLLLCVWLAIRHQSVWKLVLDLARHFLPPATL